MLEETIKIKIEMEIAGKSRYGFSWKNIKVSKVAWSRYEDKILITKEKFVVLMITFRGEVVDVYQILPEENMKNYKVLVSFCPIHQLQKM